MTYGVVRYLGKYYIRKWNGYNVVGKYFQMDKQDFLSCYYFFIPKTFREGKSELIRYIKKKNLKVKSTNLIKPGSKIHDADMFCEYSVEIDE